MFVTVAGASVWWFRDMTIPSSFAKELLAAIVSAAAISGGFLTTALSILMSLSTTQIGRQLKRKNKLGQIKQYLRSAIWSCLSLSAICVVAFFFIETESGLSTNASTLVVTSGIYALASMVRMAEIFVLIFEQMSEPEDRDG